MLSFQEKWGRILRHTKSSVLRDKVSFFTTLLVITLMLFICNVIFSLYFMSENMVTFAQQKADLYVELSDDANEFHIEALTSDLEVLEGVSHVAYTSKNEALSQFQATFPDSGLAAFLKRYEEPNPLPASIGIVTDDISQQSAIVAFLKQPRFADTVRADSISLAADEQIGRNQKILSFSYIIRTAGIAMVIISLVIMTLIIFNTISANLRARASEIEIMYLVGATDSAIRIPYIIQGVIFGILAVVISAGLMLIFSNNLHVLFEMADLSQYTNIGTNGFYGGFLWFLGVQFMIIMALGIGTSFSAVQRYFKHVYMHG